MLEALEIKKWNSRGFVLREYSLGRIDKEGLEHECWKGKARK